MQTTNHRQHCTILLYNLMGSVATENGITVDICVVLSITLHITICTIISKYITDFIQRWPFKNLLYQISYKSWLWKLHLIDRNLSFSRPYQVEKTRQKTGWTDRRWKETAILNTCDTIIRSWTSLVKEWKTFSGMLQFGRSGNMYSSNAGTTRIQNKTMT